MKKIILASLLILLVLYLLLTNYDNSMDNPHFNNEYFGNNEIFFDNYNNYNNKDYNKDYNKNYNRDYNTEIIPINIESEICEKIDIKCDIGKCGLDNLYPILDPKFNMREIAKQCLLLEDHLNNIKKRCFDCIRKHFLTIDAFLEEAVSLEKDNNNRNYYRSLFTEWVKLEKQYAVLPLDSNNLDDISKKVRLFRKPLIEKYFDIVSEYSN